VLLGTWAHWHLGSLAHGHLGSLALGLIGTWALGHLGSWALGDLGIYKIMFSHSFQFDVKIIKSTFCSGIRWPFEKYPFAIDVNHNRSTDFNDLFVVVVVVVLVLFYPLVICLKVTF
jgi:hypothetical protein